MNNEEKKKRRNKTSEYGTRLILVCLCFFCFQTLLTLTLAVGTVLDVGAKEVIPPAEGGSIVADEGLVMVVMMLSTGPEWDPVMKRPREIVAGVRVDGLEETEDDPEQHGRQVKIPLWAHLENEAGSQMIKERASDSAEAEDHGLDGVGILSSDTKRGCVFVVDLVDLLVERRPVHETVHMVVVKVLKDKEDRQLHRHFLPRYDTQGS